MSHNAKVTSQLGRYYTLKSLQPLNLDELQYLHHGGLTPPKKETQGFFHKCIESFKSNFPQVRAFYEELFYEQPQATDTYGHADY